MQKRGVEQFARGASVAYLARSTEFMDGLAAFRYVLAGARNGVAAREERGSGGQKQSDESRHVVPLGRFLVLAAVTSRIRRCTAGPSVPARALSMHLKRDEDQRQRPSASPLP